MGSNFRQQLQFLYVDIDRQWAPLELGCAVNALLLPSKREELLTLRTGHTSKTHARAHTKAVARYPSTIGLRSVLSARIHVYVDAAELT